MSIAKLVLGTAGLGGLPYGAEKRVVSRDDATTLIRHAYDSGVRRFDTAPAYGEAESHVAHAIDGRVAVVFTKTTGDVDEALQSALRFGAKVHTAYLWHNYNERIAAEREEALKQNWAVDGRGPLLPPWVRGVTTYAADRTDARPEYAVQQDWNLLQQRIPEPKPALFMARSVFLQGRLTEDGMGKGVPYDRARQMAALYGVDLNTLALRAALEHDAIDLVVVGPTTLDELAACLEIADMKPINLRDTHLAMLACNDPTVTDPRTWTP